MAMIQRMLLASVLCVAVGGAACAQPSVIRMANTGPIQSDVVQVMIRLQKALEKELGSAVKIQAYWGGALGRDRTKQYDMLKAGIADIVHVMPGFAAGRFPDFSVMELPYTAKTAVEGSHALWRLYQAGLIGGLGEVKVIGMYTTEPYGFHSRSPVRSIDDLKGLKIGVGGPVHGAIVRSLGAVPVSTQAPAVPQSLSARVIDSALFSYAAMMVFGVHNVTKYHFMGPFGVAPFFIAMNKASWERQPPKVKAAIDKYSGKVIAEWGGQEIDRTGAKGKAIVEKDKSHTIVNISEADLARGRKLAKALYQDWVDDHKDGKKKLDALEHILGELRAGTGMKK